MMKIKKSSILASAFLMAGHSYGAVVVQDQYFAGASSGAATDLGGGVFGYELDPTGFTAAGSGKLVMVFSAHDANVAGTPAVTSVTYNNVPLTQAVQAVDNGSMALTGIFYLDAVAGDGSLRVELDTSAGSSTTVHFGYGLYALDGLKAGVQDTGSAQSNAQVTAGDHEVTMTTSEGFFVQELARNNQTVSETGGDDYLTLYNYSADSYRGFSQYRVTDAAGVYAAPVGNSGDNFKRVVTAAFEADVIPEPSSIALLGLGGLAFIRRRRR